MVKPSENPRVEGTNGGELTTTIFVGVMAAGFTARAVWLVDGSVSGTVNGLLFVFVLYGLLYCAVFGKTSAILLRQGLVLVLSGAMVFDHHTGFTDNFTVLISLDLVRYGSLWANMGSNNGLFPLVCTVWANILIIFYATQNEHVEDVFKFCFPAVFFPSGLIYTWTMYHIKLLGVEKEAREASNVKSLFIAKMSHEFRTPLNAISLAVQNLQSTKISPDQEFFVSSLETSCTLLLSMVNHILSMQKTPKLIYEWHDIIHFFEETSNLFLSTASSRSINLELDINYHSVTPSPFILVDQQKLRGICINLLGNALKFTASGGKVRFSLSVKSLSGDGGMSTKNGDGNKVVTSEGDEKLSDERLGVLIIQVADTGRGIRPEDKPQIFKAFYQVESDNTTEGTGLGLSVSKQFTDLMGGKLSVDSEYGVGTVFTLSLPVSTSHSKQNSSPPSSPALTSSPLSSSSPSPSVSLYSKLLSSIHLKLETLACQNPEFPAVYIGGESFFPLFSLLKFGSLVAYHPHPHPLTLKGGKRGFCAKCNDGCACGSPFDEAFNPSSPSSPCPCLLIVENSTFFSSTGQSFPSSCPLLVVCPASSPRIYRLGSRLDEILQQLCLYIDTLSSLSPVKRSSSVEDSSFEIYSPSRSSLEDPSYSPCEDHVCVKTHSVDDVGHSSFSFSPSSFSSSPSSPSTPSSPSLLSSPPVSPLVICQSFSSSPTPILPPEKKKGKETRKRSRMSKENEKPKKVKRVLLVDDNALNVRLLAEVLGRNPAFTIASAFNGQEAVDLFSENYFDYVLMDLDMPVMNGLTASREMRKMEEKRAKGKGVPEEGGNGEVEVRMGGDEDSGGREGGGKAKIIILSGTSEESCAESTEIKHVDLFLQKPVNIPVLWGHLGEKMKKGRKKK